MIGVALLSVLFWFPLPSEPQITRRMGNSFAQLLTSNAVLIAVGLAAVGGGSGWMFWIGAVEARRRSAGLAGGGRDMEVVDAEGCRPCGVRDGSCWESASEGARFGMSFGWVVVLADWVFNACDEGDGLIVGVGGPEGKGVGVVSAELPLFWEVAPLLFVSDAPYRRALGTIIEASSRTVRWCARVARAFRVRKKRYWTIIGAREMNVVAREGSFSRRAQVK